MDEDEEVWVPAPGYENRLEVSSAGRVRSKEREVRTRNGYTRIIKSQLLNPSCSGKYGYPSVEAGVYNKEERKRVLVHRLVAEAFVPNPKKLPYVNHKDGDKGNSHPSNLEWCTHKENMQHAAKNGWMVSNSGPGEESPAHKLTESDVRVIKERLIAGESCKSIARDFSVGDTAIGEIKAGRSWSHVKVGGDAA